MSLSTVVDLDALTSDTISTCGNDVRRHDSIAATLFSNRFKTKASRQWPRQRSSSLASTVSLLDPRAASQGCGGVTIYTTVNASLTERGKKAHREVQVGGLN